MNDQERHSAIRVMKALMHMVHEIHEAAGDTQ
jgi:hypothetical protein